MKRTHSIRFLARPQQSCVWHLILAALLAFSISGCSVVLSTMGERMDVAASKRSYMECSVADSLPRGQKVRVIRTSGDTISGRCGGMVRFTETAYAKQYNRIRQDLHSEVNLPALNEIVLLRAHEPESGPAAFCGFDRDGIVVRDTSSGQDRWTPVREVSELRSRDGDVFDIDQFTRLLKQKALPVHSGLLVINGTGRHAIPLNQIKGMMSPRRTHYRAIGLATGLVIDTAILVTALMAGLEKIRDPVLSPGD